MKKAILFLFIVLTALTASSQSNNFKLTNDIEYDVRTMLPEGTIEFDVMDKVIQSPREQELISKFQQAISENYNWFLEYSSKIEPGKPMPYHKNIGLTEDEYNELKVMMENIQLAPSRVSEYTIIHNAKSIVLEPKDTVNDLTVEINFDKNKSFLDGQTLSFKDTIRVTDAQNGLKSKWFGYQWQYAEPTDIDKDNLKDLANLSVKQYKLIVGQLQDKDKIWLNIQGRVISNGIKITDYNFPFLEQ